MSKRVLDVYRCKSVDELEKISKKLLEKYEGRKVYAFIGDLGVGKTSFIKVLCSMLGAEEFVTSPTFAIVNEYKTRNDRKLFHFDLYRVNIEELYDIGYEEYLFSGDYCFIEWADKMEGLLPRDAVVVEMYEERGERVITF